MQTKNMAQAVKVAHGAASVEVAADADPANNQGPEADGGPNDNVSLAPTDPEVPPTSVGCAQSIEPNCGGENCTRLVRKLRAWTRRLRTWTWPGSPSQKAAGPDEGYPIQVVQCDYSSSTW